MQKDIKIETADQILEEELEAIKQMVNSDGWIHIKRWIEKQIDGLDYKIDNIRRDDIDLPRGERKAYRKLLDYINRSIELRLKFKVK